MFRCLVAPGTEPTPDARAQEAARLVSQFIGDFSSLRQLPIDYLRIDGELGVDLVQGFHIGRPRPVEELR
jgi:hypothetical protein